MLVQFSQEVSFANDKVHATHQTKPRFEPSGDGGSLGPPVHAKTAVNKAVNKGWRGITTSAPTTCHRGCRSLMSTTKVGPSTKKQITSFRAIANRRKNCNKKLSAGKYISSNGC